MRPHRFGLLIIAALAEVFVAAPYAAPAAIDYPIVYVRCERTVSTMKVTGTVTRDGKTQIASRELRGLDVYDTLPDVTNFLSNFSAPCDLVLREPSGKQRVLYDCSSSSTSDSSCAAMDPVVSFDGRTIAFTVFRGVLKARRVGIDEKVIDPKAEGSSSTTRLALPNRFLDTQRRSGPSGAQLHLVDVETGALTAFPVPNGVFDTGPVFLPGNRLGFTSTRDGNRSTVTWRTTGIRLGARIWSMDLDGRNLDLSSHHTLTLDQHPIILMDGRVVYSSWQIGMGRPHRHTNGSVGGSDSLDNLFHLFTQNPDGAHPFAFFGMHSGDHKPISSIGLDHKAAHFMTQTSDGRVWFADYYRKTNSGFGHIIGVMPEPEGLEGLDPHRVARPADWYAPAEGIAFAPWSTSRDSTSKPMPEPVLTHPSYRNPLPFAGKVSHPAALPRNGLMVAWGKGACSRSANHDIWPALGINRPPKASGSGRGAIANFMTHVIEHLGADTPGCDTGLYRATRIPSKHPSDLEMIVDEPDWHELFGRAVAPYQDIYGQEQPAIRPRADLANSHRELGVGTPFGLLGAASITDRETHPAGGIHFQGVKQFHQQGTDTIDYRDEELCGVRILGVMPNRGTHNAVYKEARTTLAGERLLVLGEVPVRHYDAMGNARMDSSGHQDTSFLVRFPANMPYFMQGIDCEGRTLNTDQTWQSLRPGEMKTCGGCHVHSRESRIDFSDSFAATSAYEIPHLGEGTVPLLAGLKDDGVRVRTEPGYGLSIDYQRDIVPIFQEHCVSCHGGASPAAGLALDRPGMSGPKGKKLPSTWFCLVADYKQACVPTERRHPTGKGSGGVWLGRPQVSRYVRAFNARGSLLYWKAANRRTDNRTDETFGPKDGKADYDIDFGVNHPTTITPEALGMLSRWIDIGAPGGKALLRDTQRPTLHLSAVLDNAKSRVTQLRVGTVDLGSGIAKDSLLVCLLNASGECEATLATQAEMHDVLTLPLAIPLSDTGREVLARVADAEGNVTEVRRTVGYLLDATPQPPRRERSDAGTFP